jgi:acyl CoA:acetate/3-ketoacid CoA transferase alpha subunit
MPSKHLQVSNEEKGRSLAAKGWHFVKYSDDLIAFIMYTQTKGSTVETGNVCMIKHRTMQAPGKALYHT